jgi:hypothetical protein
VAHQLSFKFLPSGSVKLHGVFVEADGRATPEIVNHPEEKNDLFLPRFERPRGGIGEYTPREPLFRF